MTQINNIGAVVAKIEKNMSASEFAKQLSNGEIEPTRSGADYSAGYECGKSIGYQEGFRDGLNRANQILSGESVERVKAPF